MGSSWGQLGAGLFNIGMSKINDRDRRRENAEATREQQDTAQRLYADKPMFASDQVPTFRRTESPVASAYLSSFLTGSNSDNVNPLAANAAAQKARAQQSFAQNHGTMASLIERDRQLSQLTPWKVTAPKTSLTKGAFAAQPWMSGTAEEWAQRDADAAKRQAAAKKKT